jgi:hypothetical protein
LDIADEEKAFALYEESEREEKNESSLEEGGGEQDDEGLSVEDRKRLEEMTPEERAVFHRLKQEQETAHRADRRRRK